MTVPFGAALLRRLPLKLSRGARGRAYRFSIVLLTFFCYTAYHLSRKALSVVKGTWYPKEECQRTANGGTNESYVLDDMMNFSNQRLYNFLNETNLTGCPYTCDCWIPFTSQAKLGYMDVTFSLAYAVSMFITGNIGDHVSVRRLLFVGMVLSGVFVCLLGLPLWTKIHSLAYFISIQAMSGVAQSTGWPGVVAVMGNWFGKGNRGRGFVMGLWNSHTSVGNILGSVIPAFWASPTSWGWSFVVPGLIIIGMGVIVFAFLVEDPHAVGCDHTHTSLADPLINTNVEDQSDEADEEWRRLLPEKQLQPWGFGASHNYPSFDQASTKNEAVSIWSALKAPGVFRFALCLFFTKFVFYIFLAWLPVYIKNNLEQEHIHTKHASFYSTLFDVGGIVGGVIAGIISDQGEIHALTCVGMLLFAVPSLWSFRKYGGISLANLLGLTFLAGSMVNGPYCLITTVVSVDLGNHEKLHGTKKAKATVAAAIDGIGSLGEALGLFVTDQGLRYLKDESWDVVVYICMGSCVIAILPLVRLCIKEIKTLLERKEKGEDPFQPVKVESAWFS